MPPLFRWFRLFLALPSYSGLDLAAFHAEEYMFGFCQKIKVVGVYTSGIQALMVKVEAFGNLPELTFVKNAMCVSGLSSIPNNSVPIDVSIPLPLPTSSGIVHDVLNRRLAALMARDVVHRLSRNPSPCGSAVRRKRSRLSASALAQSFRVRLRSRHRGRDVMMGDVAEGFPLHDPACQIAPICDRGIAAASALAQPRRVHVVSSPLDEGGRP